MSATTDRVADLLAQLIEDGDTVALGDGRTLVLHVERDDIDPLTLINDADCWGRVAWDRPNRDTGQSVRPDGFTGAARKFSLYGYALEGTVWWEPYREGHHVVDDPETVAYMRELLAEGFQQVGLELRETLTDSQGHEHAVTVDTAWLGGTDSLGNGFLREVLGDLLAELPLDGLL